jgi:hypothetical protein
MCAVLLCSSAVLPRYTSAHIPFLWHKGRDFIKTDAKGKETKVGRPGSPRHTPCAVTCYAGSSRIGSLSYSCIHKVHATVSLTTPSSGLRQLVPPRCCCCWPLQVPLLYRMATVLDEKNPHAEKRSRYLWKTQVWIWGRQHSCCCWHSTHLHSLTGLTVVLKPSEPFCSHATPLQLAHTSGS